MTRLPDFFLDEGPPDKPVVVLIHGLGMNRQFWVDPSLCPSAGGMASLTLFLHAPPPLDFDGHFSTGRPKQAYSSPEAMLKAAGFSVVAWTQRRPLGPVMDAVEELGVVLNRVRESFADTPVYLVGHSRGGLVARKFVSLYGPGNVRKLVTIATPQHGTRMASIGKQLGAAAPLLQRVLPGDARSTLTTALRHAAEFFSSPALVELMPDSEFIRSLSTPLPGPVETFTLGGTDPSLLTLYVRTRKNTQWTRLPLPGFLFNSVPQKLRPPEICPGLGDGLVSDESSRLPGTRHLSLPLNHVALAYDERAHADIAEFLAGNPLT